MKDVLTSDGSIAVTVLSIVTYILFSDAIDDFIAGIPTEVKLLVAAAMTIILALVVLDADKGGGRGMLHIADIVRPIAAAWERVREWYEMSPRTPARSCNCQKAIIPGGGLIAYLLDLAIRNWDIVLIIVAVSLAADRLGIYPVEDIAGDLFWTGVEALQTFVENILNWIGEQLNPVSN